MISVGFALLGATRRGGIRGSVFWGRGVGLWDTGGAVPVSTVGFAFSSGGGRVRGASGCCECCGWGAAGLRNTIGAAPMVTVGFALPSRRRVWRVSWMGRGVRRLRYT